MRDRLGYVLSIAGFSCALACSGSDSTPDASGGSGGATNAPSVQLEGAVQKGPFVIGSSITVSLLGEQLEPTGQVFNTQTSNDRGEFALAISAAGPVSVQGDGFYYNEVTGALSGSAITLRAFYVPGAASVQQVYVNMVTHLTTERIKALVAGGSDFSLAVAQAERELLEALAITEPGYVSGVPGTSMTVAGADTADNAYLLGVSATMIQLAIDGGSASIDAVLQEALNTFSLDLRDGTLEPQRRAQVTAALSRLDIELVTSNLTARLSALGATEIVPDMQRVLDRDGDGTADATDVCPGVADAQTDTDSDGRGDACDPCPNTACPSACLPANADSGGPATDLCYEPGTENAACRESDDPIAPGTCDEGLRCVGARVGGLNVPLEGLSDLCGPFDNCCLPAGGPGEVCDSNGSCDEGFQCAQGTICGHGAGCCISVGGGEGQHCRIDGSCEAGLLCVTTPACSGVDGGTCCQPMGGEGQPCTAEHTCDQGLGCIAMDGCGENGCCHQVGDAGEACIESGGPGGEGTCNAGLACLQEPACDTGLWRCCQAAGGQGQPCEGTGPIETRTCDADLTCSESAACESSGASACCLSPT